MSEARPLPKFCRPPLIEVVHGIQFLPLQMTIAHPGLFYLRIKDRYPQVQTVGALPPSTEVFESNIAGRMTFQLMNQAGLPRAWFVSGDDTSLVQLQQDRLLLNWRSGPGEAPYPHFNQVTVEFQAVYDEFRQFAASQNLGQVAVSQCEMTYVNHLHPKDASLRSVNVSDYLRVWQGHDPEEWSAGLEDLSFSARYLLRNAEGLPIGRLTASLAPAVGTFKGDQLVQLELTVRGIPPSTDPAGVKEFHVFAHENIVRCFASMTCPEAHQRWGRLQ